MKSLFFVPFVIFALNGFSQETSSEAFSNNVISGTGGTAAIYFMATINYEHKITETSFVLSKSIYFKAAAGPWGTWGAGGYLAQIGLTFLSGSNNGHFEISAGGAAMYDDYVERTSLVPAGSLGYRFQSPGTGLMFRAGLGFPETLYLGIGFSF